MSRTLGLSAESGEQRAKIKRKDDRETERLGDLGKNFMRLEKGYDGNLLFLFTLCSRLFAFLYFCEAFANFIGVVQRFSPRRHKVWLQTELARPLFLIAMVLVASAFTMRHTRSGGTGIAVLSAVLLGFGLYFIRSFAQILGENGQIPVFLAAWAPPVAAIMLALGLLLHREDG